MIAYLHLQKHYAGGKKDNRIGRCFPECRYPAAGIVKEHQEREEENKEHAAEQIFEILIINIIPAKQNPGRDIHPAFPVLTEERSRHRDCIFL